MPAFIKNLTFDCADALRLARFWAAALGSDVDEDSSAQRAYVEPPGWGGPNIWFRGGRGPKAAVRRSVIKKVDCAVDESRDTNVEPFDGLDHGPCQRRDP